MAMFPDGHLSLIDPYEDVDDHHLPIDCVDW